RRRQRRASRPTRIIATHGEHHNPQTKEHTSPTAATNGAPVSEELSATRAGLHELENNLDRVESALSHAPTQPVEPPRARMIDFLSPRSPVTASPSIGAPPQSGSSRPENSEPRA